MSNKTKRVIIWSTWVSELLNGNVCGIGVQLFFWAQTFSNHGWVVTTLSRKLTPSQDNIHFKQTSKWGKFEIIHEWISILWSIVTIHPQLIIYRGADRVVYPLSVLSKLFRVKFVLFGASDTNFELKGSVGGGGNHNVKLWQDAIKNLDYVVVQNSYQQTTLKDNYGRPSIILYNLWGKMPEPKEITPKHTDVIWVANLRRMKRADWMVNAAKAMPEFDFTLVGGPAGREQDHYDEIARQAETLPNLHFLGKKDFAETNAIVSKARLLCCTSTYEGFPNTFLQAWSNDIPVVSTVNPSELITTKQLGAYVQNETEFQERVRQLLEDQNLYKKITTNIHGYFMDNHDADRSYTKLIDWLKID